MGITVKIIALCVMTGSLEVLSQVSSICRPNENFLSCGGCQKTCDEPEPVCTAVCRTGCYCPDDLVRNVDGLCIPLSNCPPTNSKLPYQSGIYQGYKPGSVEPICPENEEYQICEPCNKTCDNPNPICPAQCARGCFCKGDLVRDRDGQCVPVQQCSKVQESNYMKRESIPTCGPNEEFKECQTCEKTCSNLNPFCPAQCTRGCSCKEGLVKSPSGECIKLKDCPKEECTDENAEYTCRYPCENFCSAKPCAIRAKRCSLGCYCKPGYLKEDTTGRCVKPVHCTTKRVY